jgi:hypothetical protein
MTILDWTVLTVLVILVCFFELIVSYVFATTMKTFVGIYIMHWAALAAAVLLFLPVASALRLSSDVLRYSRTGFVGLYMFFALMFFSTW